jgi:hypothetical protein
VRRRSHTLASEVAELEAVLSRIPESSVIERFGFEQRLKTARAALEKVKDSIEPERAQLTFRGVPVKGSQGIHAEFGGKAAIAFTEAFTAIMAGMKDRLNYMGPIPDKTRNQPLITGTAVGSFGFEFELPSLHPEFFSDSGGAEEALERFFSLLQVSSDGTDDDVAELIAEVHPRAVRKVAAFLEYLSRNQSWCGIEFKTKVFKYRNLEQLRHSRDRLSESNIRENREIFRGELQGVLPKGRTFEFKIGGTEQILRGKVGLGIEDPDVLNRDWLHRPINITLNVFQVGKSRPSYILADLNSLVSI